MSRPSRLSQLLALVLIATTAGCVCISRSEYDRIKELAPEPIERRASVLLFDRVDRKLEFIDFRYDVRPVDPAPASRVGMGARLRSGVAFQLGAVPVPAGEWGLALQVEAAGSTNLLVLGEDRDAVIATVPLQVDRAPDPDDDKLAVFFDEGRILLRVSTRGESFTTPIVPPGSDSLNRLLLTGDPDGCEIRVRLNTRTRIRITLDPDQAVEPSPDGQSILPNAFTFTYGVIPPPDGALVLVETLSIGAPATGPNAPLELTPDTEYGFLIVDWMLSDSGELIVEDGQSFVGTPLAIDEDDTSPRYEAFAITPEIVSETEMILHIHAGEHGIKIPVQVVP